MGLFTESDDPYPNINRLCQLHERVEVVYLVDCYEARLNVGEGEVYGVAARGPTVFDALAELDRLLEPFKDVRSYRKAMFDEART